MLDYATLRVIWWILLGILLIGFAIMDGFDLGIGILLPRTARNDNERRVIINTIGPVWEGNQIWFILGGGAIFAAWPILYAVAFSGFYFAMLMVLLALILRPVAFKYRSKISNSYWTSMCDYGIFISGLVPALIFGVAIGNVLQGVPFYFDNELRAFYTGSLLELLNPFALLCGLLSITMLVMHGATFLGIKTDGIIQKRAVYYGQVAAIITMVLFIIAGLCITFAIKGYELIKPMAYSGPSNPLFKQVQASYGAWLHNYFTYPWLILVPTMAFISAIMVIIFMRRQYFKVSWLMSAISVASIITTVGVSMFPFILPSISHPNMSLMVWDSSSSSLTLRIMLVATSIFMPIIIFYTSWVYHVLRGKVSSDYSSKDIPSSY